MFSFLRCYIVAVYGAHNVQCTGRYARRMPRAVCGLLWFVPAVVGPFPLGFYPAVAGQSCYAFMRRFACRAGALLRLPSFPVCGRLRRPRLPRRGSAPRRAPPASVFRGITFRQCPGPLSGLPPRMRPAYSGPPGPLLLTRSAPRQVVCTACGSKLRHVTYIIPAF